MYMFERQVGACLNPVVNYRNSSKVMDWGPTLIVTKEEKLKTELGKTPEWLGSLNIRGCKNKQRRETLAL